MGSPAGPCQWHAAKHARPAVIKVERRTRIVAWWQVAAAFAFVRRICEQDEPFDRYERPKGKDARR